MVDILDKEIYIPTIIDGDLFNGDELFRDEPTLSVNTIPFLQNKFCRITPRNKLPEHVYFMAISLHRNVLDFENNIIYDDKVKCKCITYNDRVLGMIDDVILIQYGAYSVIALDVYMNDYGNTIQNMFEDRLYLDENFELGIFSDEFKRQLETMSSSAIHKSLYDMVYYNIGKKKTSVDSVVFTGADKRNDRIIQIAIPDDNRIMCHSAGTYLRVMESLNSDYIVTKGIHSDYHYNNIDRLIKSSILESVNHFVYSIENKKAHDKYPNIPEIVKETKY